MNELGTFLSEGKLDINVTVDFYQEDLLMIAGMVLAVAVLIMLIQQLIHKYA